MTRVQMKRLAVLVGMVAVLGLLAGCARGSFTLPTTLTAMNIPQGRSGTQSIAITRTGNFRGEISFSVTGAPTGVTARFDPTATTATGATTTLTLTVGEAVAVQRHTLRVVATSGRIRREVNLEVNVQVRPDFTMATAPAALTVRQGASGSVTINLTRTATMTAAVALTLEGAPAGVTGTFTPASVTAATSTLAISVGTAAAPGAYTLTVRGRGDGLDKTATIRLTVEAAPDFSFILLPTAVSVVRGESANVAVNLTRVGGFADAVRFEAEGLPTGVTATFDPNPAPAAATTLRIAAAAEAAAGTYPIRVRGTAGAISKVVTINITIP